MGNEEATMDADLRSRMVSQEHKTAALDQRMTTLEQWRAQSDIADARKEEQFKSLLEKFGIIDRKIDKTNGYLMAIVIAIILGMIGAFVKLMQTGIPG